MQNIYVKILINIVNFSHLKMKFTLQFQNKTTVVSPGTPGGPDPPTRPGTVGSPRTGTQPLESLPGDPDPPPPPTPACPQSHGWPPA